MAVTYGWITGTVLQPIADTETADDRTPADRPSAGEVILTPLIAATADGKIIARDSIRRPLDADGYIVDLDGRQGVAVPVGSYRVEWALVSGRWPAHDITVTAEHTLAAPLSLADAVPASVVQPLPQTIGEAVAEAEGYADAAGVSAGQAIQAAAQSSGLTLIESPPGSGFLAYHATLLTESPEGSGFLEIGLPA